MSVSINAKAAGGFSTYGQSSYDAREDRILVRASEGETVNFIATFPEEISTVDTSDGGSVTVGEPTISGASMTFTLSNFTANAWAQYAVMLASGEVRYLNIAIAPVLLTRGSSSDYGAFA